MSKPQIINIIDEFSREKYIPKEELFKVLEKAFGAVAKIKYGHSRNIKVSVNRITATPSFYHGLLVVNENPNVDQILLEDAKKSDENIQLDDVLLQKLPDIQMTREYMQIVQKIFIREIEDIKLERQYQEFSERIGDILQVAVKQIEKRPNGSTSVLVSIEGQGEGSLKIIPGEVLRIKERVSAQLIDVVRPNLKSKFQDNQLIFTRTSEDFVAKLLEKHVVEIKEKTIEIMALARLPGFKTKIAVRSTEIGKYGRSDPVYPCIGPNGMTVKEISKELSGEKVDIFKWSDDLKELVTHALYPVIPYNINVINHMVEVIVADSFIGQALGSQGKNIRLISNIIGKKVNVFTQDQAKFNKEKTEQNIETLKEALSLDELTARLLVINGYSKPLDIINGSGYLYDLGLKPEAVEGLIMDAKYVYALSIFEEFELSQNLFDILQTLDVDELIRCIKIAEAKILSVQDFCRLTTDDFKKIVFDTTLSDERIEDLLMTADNMDIEQEDEDFGDNENHDEEKFQVDEGLNNEDFGDNESNNEDLNDNESNNEEKHQDTEDTENN